MTLIDAILATLGGLWAIVSAPLAVVAYGTALVFAGVFAFIGGFAGSNDDYPFWTRIPYWVIGLAIFLLGFSMFVWISGSYSPFTWSKP